LAGYSSGSTRGVEIEPDATPEADPAVDEEETSTAGLPLWPIVGMCLGVAALVAVLLHHRRDDEEV
jgi:hypothetical protein